MKNILTVLLLLGSAAAWAVPPDCATTANAYKLKYDFPGAHLSYCDNNTYAFINMDDGDQDNCTPAEKGKVTFVNGILQACNGATTLGANDCPVSAFNCVNPGNVIKTDPGFLMLCTTTNKWQILGTGCLVVDQCSTFNGTSDEICNATTGSQCIWKTATKTCKDVSAICASYGSSFACNADADCSWNASVCTSNY